MAKCKALTGSAMKGLRVVECVTFPAELETDVMRRLTT